MNMQQMMIQAQKMQREMKKQQDELHQQEFTITKGGAVTVTMKGSKEVTKIDISGDAFTPEDKEMVEEMVMMAINELISQIEEKEEAIQEKVTGRSGGFGF